MKKKISLILGSYNNLALLYESYFESKKITAPYCLYIGIYSAHSDDLLTELPVL